MLFFRLLSFSVFLFFGRFLIPQLAKFRTQFGFGFSSDSDSANELKIPMWFCQHFDSANLLKFGSLFFRKRLKFHVKICQIPIFYKLKFQPKVLIWNGISALNPTCWYKNSCGFVSGRFSDRKIRRSKSATNFGQALK